MAQFVQCKWCGVKVSSIAILSSQVCTKNPERNAKHELYEGSEKKEHNCKYCGYRFQSIMAMSQQMCTKNPNKGRHEPAL